MSTNKMYRRPEALPALDRIIANRWVRTRVPHTWEKAVEVRRRMRRDLNLDD